MAAQQRGIDRILAAREDINDDSEEDGSIETDDDARTQRREERYEARAEIYDKTKRYTKVLGRAALRGFFGIARRARASIQRR